MQTSIEWLINQVEDNMGDIPPEIKEQAKQMEKDQIEESWNDGNLLGRNGHVLLEYSTGEQYYNETYGKDLPELRYKDGRPMRKYNSPKLQEMVDLMNEPDTSSQREITYEEVKKVFQGTNRQPITFEPIEISDEEIEYLAESEYPYDELVNTELKGLIVSAERAAWIEGIKWYREQLKKKQL